ncbi:MAG TPA: phosphate acetyltransferase [Anaerolineae bacterium]|nr:phosphate acetyltransferase [Anaerolineae bacterium]
MTNCIYIATAEPRCGKSLISLGLTDMLLRRTRRIGVFRPIISVDSPDHRDKNIDLLLSYFNLDLEYADTYAFLMREANELRSQNRDDELLDRIFEKYKALERRSDFVLCIGSDFVGEGSAFEFEMNAQIAKNLGCPVLVVGHAADRTVEEAVTPVQMAIDAFLERECQVLGTIVNRVEPDLMAELRASLQHRLPDIGQFISVIPANRSLSSPTMQEIAQHLQAEVLYGEEQLTNQAYRYLIIAMQMHHYLPRLSENALIITPGDRGEIILSALQAHVSHSYPQLAGIMLTTGLKPPPTVMTLLDGLSPTLPIIAVEQDPYETATELAHIRSYINAHNDTRIALSLKLFDEYVNTYALEERISSVEVRGMTPRMFLYNITQKAKVDKKHIVLPEGTDERILKATEILTNQDALQVTLLGHEAEVKAAIRRFGKRIDLAKIQIVDPAQSPHFFDYVETLYQLRRHKCLSLDNARDWMLDVSYFGTMMVYKGHADGMVSGATHTTEHTIRPALQFIKTQPGISIVSSVFFMCLEDRVLIYGDCAVNPNPNAEELAEIAISSADTARAFGLEPKVAMLSYSSGESGKGEDVEKVRQATQIAQERRPDLLIDGPMQYDAAVDPYVGQRKMPDSPVAGQASVLIFPDLNTGNNTYKAVQRETGGIAIGPILQGLNKPVNDLSRGSTVDDVINTILFTVLQAQQAAEHQ